MHLDEYNEPSEDLINDWNIHNDHQDDNEDDETMNCDWCEQPFIPHWSQEICDACQAEYWYTHPDPAEIAEREEREAENFGLEDYYDYGY